MSLFKIALKAGASATLLAVLAVPASADNIFTGGSSLLAPYMAQVYCARVGGLTGATAHCSTTAVDSDHGRLFNTTSIVNIVNSGFADTSAPDTTNLFSYLISNSGGGQKAILANESSLLGTYPASGTYTNVPYPRRGVILGFSDAALSSAALSAYASGGAIGDLSITLCAPGVPAASCTGTATYVNPQTNGFGNLVQIPATIDPVAVGYNPTGLTGLTTHKLKLDKLTYCKIFNHIITDWNDSAITALNGGSVTGGTSLAIRLVGRGNGSGTTSIFAHHLDTVCTPLLGASNEWNSTNLSGSAYKNIPSTLTAFYSYTGNTSSAPEVADINGTTGSIGYVGADYADTSTAVTTTVASALLDNGGTYYDPSAANAISAFGSILPPQSNSDGTFNASVTGNGLRTDPAAWAPTTYNPSSGYPIIGLTNIVTYTTSGSSARAAALVGAAGGGAPEGLLRWYYDNANTIPFNVMDKASLGTLPAAWNTAITESFVTGSDSQGNVIH